MPTITRTFTIDAVPAAVLDYLLDFSHAEQWDPGTVTCTRRDSGPLAVGASWHNVSKIAGVTTELTYTLMSLSEDTIVLVGKNDTATSVDTITVVPDGGRTRVTYKAELAMHGAAKLATPIIKVVFEKVGSDLAKQMTEVLTGLGH